MCLLERIVDWNDQRIALETTTHRSQSNPLRRNDRLRAIHLCEYGAQAMAVHGALKSRAAGGDPAQGMLVSLRSVTLACNYIEALPGASQWRQSVCRPHRRACSMRFGSRMPANCWLKVARQSC